jgi:hypothetical protein
MQTPDDRMQWQRTCTAYCASIHAAVTRMVAKAAKCMTSSLSLLVAFGPPSRGTRSTMPAAPASRKVRNRGVRAAWVRAPTGLTLCKCVRADGVESVLTNEEPSDGARLLHGSPEHGQRDDLGGVQDEEADEECVQPPLRMQLLALALRCAQRLPLVLHLLCGKVIRPLQPSDIIITDRQSAWQEGT